MHEQSLVRSLLSQVERIANQHGSQSVTHVEVEIGPLSGVEPSLVESAFELLRPNSCVDQAQLTIRNVSLRIRCQDCDRESDLDQFRFRCAHCESGAVTVIQGDAFRLLSVTITDEETTEAAGATG